MNSIGKRMKKKKLNKKFKLSRFNYRNLFFLLLIHFKNALRIVLK